MINIIVSEQGLETIVSCLINEKIAAERDNKNGDNDAFIKCVDNALEELKQHN